MWGTDRPASGRYSLAEMPGNQPVYSTDQREALIRRVLEDGLSAARATKEANAGELPGRDGPLEPFGVTAETAREWVRERREDIAAETPPSPEEWIGVGKRLWTLHVRELERLERLQKTNPRQPAKIEKRDESLDRRLAAATKRHKEMAALLTKPGRGDQIEDHETAKPEKPKTVFEQIAEREAIQSPTNAEPNPPDQGTKEGTKGETDAALGHGDSNGDSDSIGVDPSKRDEMVSRVLARSRADRASPEQGPAATSTDPNQ